MTEGLASTILEMSNILHNKEINYNKKLNVRNTFLECFKNQWGLPPLLAKEITWYYHLPYVDVQILLAAYHLYFCKSNKSVNQPVFILRTKKV